MGQGADQVMATATDDPAAIEAEIAQTRAELSGTIDAIQQRLNPDTLGEQAKEKVEDLAEQAKAAAREAVQEAQEAVRVALLEAKDNLREATIGRVETMAHQVSDTAYEAREGVMATIRQNPIPAALVGVGLGWLWMNRRSAPTRRMAGGYPAMDRAYRGRGYYPGEQETYLLPGDSRYGNGRTQDGGNPIANAAGRAQHLVGDTAGRVGQTLGDTASQVGETAGNVAGQVGQTASNLASTVGETASNFASSTQGTAGNLVSGVQQQAQRAEDRFGLALRENPLAVGAVALALGAAVGLVLPQTDRENQLMGEARDTLVERAQGVAQEAVEKVQSVASEAQQTVKDEAKKQGLAQ